MFDKLFRKKSENTEKKEPNMSGDRFSDMEKDLQEANPERSKEAAGGYIISPIVEENKIEKEPSVPVNPSGNNPSVFSSGRNFTKQLGEMQSKNHDEEEARQQIEGMPVFPKNNKQEYSRSPIREEQVQEALKLEQESFNLHQQTVRVIKDIPIPEAPLPENARKTAHGYLVSAVMNEQQFSEFLKGNKSVLKLFPVLADNPEKAAKLIESKEMIPVEVLDYNFFKQQVERVEQLAAENNITIVRSTKIY
jgi:hypothetical protein